MPTAGRFVLSDKQVVVCNHCVVGLGVSRVFVSAVAVSVVAGCTSGSAGRSSKDDVAAWCAREVECSAADAGGSWPETQSECENAWYGWVPPTGCVSAAQGANCAAVRVAWFGSTPPLGPLCFPACPGQGAGVRCNGNLVTSCDVGVGGGRSATFDCNVICARANKTSMGCDATRSTDPIAACGCK
jgi:hypothetical protein